MFYEKSCGAVVFKQFGKNYKVLLIQHILGHWGFPKGHSEGMETDIQTAIREIKEETGIDVVIDKNFRKCVSYSPKNNVTKDVIYFIGIETGGVRTLQKDETQIVDWYTYEEALKLITYENDKIILKLANKYIIKKLEE